MTDLYRRASDRFERVIATAHASSLLDHLDPLDRLQILLAFWEARQPFWSASVLPVALGVGEECGELAEANGHDDVVDAIGDIAIYACQVATRERLATAGPGSKQKTRDVVELPYLDGVQHAAFPEVTP